ncbi:MAG: hypothetical protein ACE5JH_03950 [Acidobacteriota bacterium]
MRPATVFRSVIPMACVLCGFLSPAAAPTGGERREAEPLADRVLARLRSDREALQRFSWVETAVLEKRARDGSIRDRTIEVHEITFRDGRRYERRLSFDADRDADGFAIMRQEESRFLRSQDPSEGALKRAKESPLRAERLLQCFRLRPIGVEALDGNPSLKVQFEPIPGCLTGGRAARLLQRVSGMIWLDERTADIRRLEGRLQQPVSFGFGILGRVDSFEIDFDRMSVALGVWSMVRATYRARGRLFLFRSFDVTSTRFRSAFALSDPDRKDAPTAGGADAAERTRGGAPSSR